MKKWTLGISLSMLKILKGRHKIGYIAVGDGFGASKLEVVCVGDKFWMFVTDSRY